MSKQIQLKQIYIFIFLDMSVIWFRSELQSSDIKQFTLVLTNFLGNGKPTLHNGKRTIDNGKPTLESRKPKLENVKPTLDNEKPILDGGKIVIGH